MATQSHDSSRSTFNYALNLTLFTFVIDSRKLSDLHSIQLSVVFLGASEQALRIQQQIYDLKDDYSLSKREYKDQKRALIKGASWEDRRFLDD